MGKMTYISVVLIAVCFVPPSGAQNKAAGKPEACWQQAGISKAAMRQRKAVEQSAHSRELAVCQNSSMNSKQQLEQINDIRTKSLQEADALITPQQKQSLEACAKARGDRTTEAALTENPCKRMGH